MTPHPEPLSTGELDDLNTVLMQLTSDLVSRLAIAATTPWATSNNSNQHTHTQPRSRPPYALGAETTLTTLREVLATTITAISHHRNDPPPPDVTTLVQAATWIRKHHIALAGMPTGRAHANAIHQAITTACRTITRNDDTDTFRMTDTMRRDANRHIVTAPQVAVIARRCGLAADGLTEHRVTNLRRRHGLKGEQDPTTRTWFYRLGDVIAAHETANQTRRGA